MSIRSSRKWPEKTQSYKMIPFSLLFSLSSYRKRNHSIYSVYKVESSGCYPNSGFLNPWLGSYFGIGADGMKGAIVIHAGLLGDVWEGEWLYQLNEFVVMIIHTRSQAFVPWLWFIRCKSTSDCGNSNLSTTATIHRRDLYLDQKDQASGPQLKWISSQAIIFLREWP